MGIFPNYNKPGKGLSKEDVDKKGLALYADILFRRIGKLFQLNLLYVLASIPAIIICFFVATYLMGSVAFYENVKGAESLMLMLSVPFITILLMTTGSGPATASLTYILRKFIKDDHVWIWSDFLGNMKSNFKQGLAIYIINTVFISVAGFSFLFYNYVMQGTMAFVLKTLIMIVVVVFAVMQQYTYALASGFELKIKHIYKNAFLLTLVGLKWNLLSFVVTVAFIFGVYSLLAESFVIGVFVILLLYFSFVMFTQLFITNNVVKKYMEDPAQQKAE